MEKIQWGIIGCGDVTEVKSGPAFSKVPDAALVAVMRRDVVKAKDYARRHGVAKWYTDAQQLINDPEVTAIYVATPPNSHEAYAEAALQAGKPVYLEKPMTTNAAAAERIVKVVQDTGVKLSVAHYRRQQPLFKKVRELLAANAIGTIRFVSLQYCKPSLTEKEMEDPKIKWRLDTNISGGGLFHDLAPHQLDLMIYFFGDVKIAYGMAYNQSGLYDADDMVSGSILFKNDILFQGLWCFSVPPEETKDQCEIIGSEGKITFSVFNHNPITITKNGKTESLNFDKLAHVQQPMIEKVTAYFLHKTSNPCTAAEGLEVMKLMDTFTVDKRNKIF